MEKNEVIKSVYECLKKKTEGKGIKEEVVEKIAEEIATEMNDLGIDVRWKDYVEADVTEDKDIYVTVGRRDLDFDKEGKRMGSGMYMHHIKGPWEKEIG